MTLAPELAPAGVFAVAWLLDVTLGEPPAALHPVVWMGRAIRPLTRVPKRAPSTEFAVGAAYALSVVLGCSFAGYGLMRLCAPWPWLQAAVEVYLLWSCFALRGLLQAGAVMADALARRDLEASREALRSLCSRDPSALSSTELAGATIESLSENASDSVVAPLFWFALGGVPLVLAYRAANTLDAMVGYRGRFEYLGKLAARLDDLLNVVPARLTALLLLCAGALGGLPGGAGFAIWRRDARNTDSPNAGHPMAMTAGLVGARLDKRETYVLGGELPPPDAAALSRTLGLVRLAGWLAAALCFMVLAVVGVWRAAG